MRGPFAPPQNVILELIRMIEKRKGNNFSALWVHSVQCPFILLKSLPSSLAFENQIHSNAPVTDGETEAHRAQVAWNGVPWRQDRCQPRSLCVPDSAGRVNRVDNLTQL